MGKGAGNWPEHRSFRLTSDRVSTWLAVGFLVLIAGMFLFTGHRNPRERAHRVHCKSHLRAIGIACHLYADDNGDRFPDMLSQLGTEHLKFCEADAKAFTCPSAGDHKTPSYTLVPGLRNDMPADFVLAYEASLENHGGNGRNVLSIDSSVEWWRADREAEFQQRLTEQAEKIRNWKPAVTAGGAQP